MSHNPYSPLDAAPVDTEHASSRVCTVMFWLSCVLCLVAFGIAANGGYQYWSYTTVNGIALPASILGESICVACSAFGMLASAMFWRKRSIGAGTALLAASLLAFFVGPLVI